MPRRRPTVLVTNCPGDELVLGLRLVGPCRRGRGGEPVVLCSTSAPGPSGSGDSRHYRPCSDGYHPCSGCPTARPAMVPSPDTGPLVGVGRLHRGVMRQPPVLHGPSVAV
jgi:hypothetical protein